MNRFQSYLKRHIYHVFNSLACLGKTSYLNPKHGFQIINPNWSINSHDLLDHSFWIDNITSHYVEHRFDILGSGWIRVVHGMTCRDITGYNYNSSRNKQVQKGRADVWLKTHVTSKNYKESKRLWKLLDSSYIPINWDIDFKSGYQWPSRKWHGLIKISPKPGVDIKVPWELGRMQHLVHLFYAYMIARDYPGILSFDKQVYLNEINNQVIDFIAQNPPGYGVQWKCPMDVGIRIANIALVYGLLISNGIKLDETIKNIVTGSFVSHGRFLIENLEWQENFRGNHYLANLAGLLFSACLLKPSIESDSWLLLSIQELFTEAKLQFLEDGTNYEGSTCYHRLSAELIIWSTVIIRNILEKHSKRLINLSKEGISIHKNIGLGKLNINQLIDGNMDYLIPEEHLSRIVRMVDFMADITRPDQVAVQIGDNDSGRLFKLEPFYNYTNVKSIRERFVNCETYRELSDDTDYFLEKSLDFRGTAAAASALIDIDRLAEWFGDKRLDSIIALAINNTQKSSILNYSDANVALNKSIYSDKEFNFDNANIKTHINITLPGKIQLNDGLRFFSYPDFGIYIYRSKRLYMLIRCGPIGQCGLGGHAHADQLSFELYIDGMPVITDPGSYIYTPIPELRNLYRSSRAHNGIGQNGINDPVYQSKNLFLLNQKGKGICLFFDCQSFVGIYKISENIGYSRQIILRDYNLEIIDHADCPSSLLDSRNERVYYSPAYGWQSREPVNQLSKYAHSISIS